MKQKITNLYLNIKNKIDTHDKTISKIVFVVFMISYIIMTIFHEPWFDEAQAWLIARDCSYKEILFTVGHYEGHPFLWYFILSIPAKLGVPFEIGLKSVGFIISTISAYLVIYKAPFPKIVNYIIPFTYFFFYQYGIIVRPYGLMLLLFILSAIVFKDKDEHPWKLIILLMLQCFLNAYGLLLAGGIAFCWCIDIFKEYNYSFKNLKIIIKDKRFIPLLVLLLSAIFVLSTIYSYPDTYSAADDARNSKLICFITALLTFLSDALITTSPFFNSDFYLLQSADINSAFVIAGGFVELVLVTLIICFSAKKNLKYFFIPHFCFVVFSSLVYFGVHHIGIISIYFLFWCWTNCDDSYFAIGRIINNKLQIIDNDQKKLKLVAIVILCVSLLCQLVWNAKSNIIDIQYEYSYGRKTAKFLKETGLDQLKVAGHWMGVDSSDKDENMDYNNMNTRLTGFPTLILAYYDHNFVYTVNGGENKSFTTYVAADAQINEENIKSWRQQGIPDVLIANVNVELLTNYEVTLDDYAPVFAMEMNYILKGERAHGINYIYLRKELLEQYNLKELEIKKYDLAITDEMIKRYEEGESIESILEPFFKEVGLLDD